MSFRERVLGCLVLLLAVFVGVRIWTVNQNRIVYPAEEHTMGEEVALDGAFLDVIQENTSGYSVSVKGAEKMTSDEYLRRYAPDASPSVSSYGSGDVVVLTYQVRNHGNSSGYLNMVSLVLVGEGRNTFYKVDSELWEASEPKIRGNSNGLVLTPNSEYVTHLPFSYMESADLFTSTLENKNTHRVPIGEEAFSLVVANAPTRKVVDVKL